jgi:hypothetical protein
MTCSYCRATIVRNAPTCAQCGGPLTPSRHTVADLFSERAKDHLMGMHPYAQRAMLSFAAGANNPLSVWFETVAPDQSLPRMKWMP